MAVSLRFLQDGFRKVDSTLRSRLKDVSGVRVIEDMESFFTEVCWAGRSCGQLQVEGVCWLCLEQSGCIYHKRGGKCPGEGSRDQPH